MNIPDWFENSVEGACKEQNVVLSKVTAKQVLDYSVDKELAPPNTVKGDIVFWLRHYRAQHRPISVNRRVEMAVAYLREGLNEQALNILEPVLK